MQADLIQKQKILTVDVANDKVTHPARLESNDIFIDVPNHVQPSLDSVLDYYADNGQKLEIKLCGSPLDIVSEFISQVEATLPESLLNNGRDAMDFIIYNLCEFSREKSISHMTFNFVFQRKGQGTIS